MMVDVNFYQSYERKKTMAKHSLEFIIGSLLK
jgi:hypothetical protein